MERGLRRCDLDFARSRRRWTPRRFSREHALWNRPRRGSRPRAASRARCSSSGQSYYHAWYLSRELRAARLEGRRAGLRPQPERRPSSTTATTSSSRPAARDVLRAHLDFLEHALDTYDVFHFSNAHALRVRRPAPGALRRAVSPGRRHRAAASARQEDRLLEQRLPRRRRADVVRGAGTRCRRARSARSATSRRSAATSATSPGGSSATGMADLQVTDRRQPRRLQQRRAGPRGPGVLLPRSGPLAPGPARARRTTASRSPTSTVKLYHSIGNLELAARARRRAT